MPDTTIKCGLCSREQVAKPAKSGEAKLPAGWKRHDSHIYCRDCWKKSFILRAVTLPVGSVIDGGEWGEFFSACKDNWRHATDVANWAVTELARNDTPRKASDERLATFKAPYLYPGARDVAPEMTPTSVVALLHAVEGRYRKARLATLWFRTQSHPVYRYPVPLPIHAQSWQCVEGDGGRACISFRLGARRWLVSLATARHKRQLVAWRRILRGGAIATELSILGQEGRHNDHRNDGEERQAGGGRRKTMRVMAKLVAWFPRKEGRVRDGVLYLRTDGTSFWVYHVGTSGEVKHLKAEHLKRWQAQHRRFLAGASDGAAGEGESGKPPVPIDKIRSRQAQHRRHLDAMADDMKHEKRWPKDVRRQTGERRDLWVIKYRNRVDAFTHEASAMLAKFAERNNVTTVVYDDTDQSFVDRFPWRQLRDRLEYKLEERGITLKVAAKSDTAGGDDEAEGAEAQDAE